MPDRARRALSDRDMSLAVLKETEPLASARRPTGRDARRFSSSITVHPLIDGSLQRAGRDGEMREPQMSKGPGRPFPTVRIDSDAEEGHLEAETRPIVILKMARCVPPFGPVLIGRPMIARKLELVAWLGETKLTRQRRERNQKENDGDRDSSAFQT